MGIALSFPIGTRAGPLGRRSNLPVVKLFCVVFSSSFFRGVPLITLLFRVPGAGARWPSPEDFPTSTLFRAAIFITLFSSAYMAENIRGGFAGATTPGRRKRPGRWGLSAWQTTLMISFAAGHPQRDPGHRGDSS